MEGRADTRLEVGPFFISPGTRLLVVDVALTVCPEGVRPVLLLRADLPTPNPLGVPEVWLHVLVLHGEYQFTVEE